MTARSLHLLASGLADAIGKIPRFEISGDSLSNTRTMVEKLFAQGVPVVAGVTRKQVNVPRREGSTIRVLAYVPATKSGPVPFVLLCIEADSCSDCRKRATPNIRLLMHRDHLMTLSPRQSRKLADKTNLTHHLHEFRQRVSWSWKIICSRGT